jgi:hypothetical protein
MTNMRHGADHYFTFVSFIALELQAAVGLGMLISASIRSVEAAPQAAAAADLISTYPFFSQHGGACPRATPWCRWLRWWSSSS